MPEVKLPKKPVENWEQVRDEWIRAVEQLVSDVELWCREKDWPTRRIDKHMEESRIGEYVVPALVFQVELGKVMLEPAARFASGCDGVVDLYLMPQYDEMASIYRRAGGWKIRYSVTGDAVPSETRIDQTPVFAAIVEYPLTAEEFAKAVKYLI